MLTLIALLTLQQATAPAQSSPIAKIVVTPGLKVTVPAQDSLRLSASPVDAEGKPVPGATVQYFSSGGRFEGSVDSTGMVTSGSTGTITVTVVARVAGTRPVTERVEVTMVPGPAARIDVAPAVGTLVIGQRVRLEGSAWSKAGDRRYEAFSWSSSAPRVASVRSDGMVTALAAGEAVITAREASAGESAVRGELRIRVLPTQVATVDLTPATSSAKQGDVVRFKAVAKDAQGREIPGPTPQWTMSS